MPSTYNNILGRTSQATFGAISSIKHQVMKFPTKAEIGEVLADQPTSRNWYFVSLKNKGIAKSLPINFWDNIEDLNQKIPESRVSSYSNPSIKRERLVSTGWFPSLGTTQKWTHQISYELSCIFSWSPTDMPGIIPKVFTHYLNVWPEYKLVQLKKRCLGIKQQNVAEEEVDKLLEDGFVHKIAYPQWLDNIVMLKKGNEKWRMCVEFTNLNKARPKDNFLLPRIN